MPAIALADRSAQGCCAEALRDRTAPGAYRPGLDGPPDLGEDRGVRFELVGAIEQIETIAAGPGVKVRSFLRKTYGRGRWRKLKGVAIVRLPNGKLRRVELHWYEAHGIGKRDIKIKRYVDTP